MNIGRYRNLTKVMFLVLPHVSDSIQVKLPTVVTGASPMPKVASAKSSLQQRLGELEQEAGHCDGFHVLSHLFVRNLHKAYCIPSICRQSWQARSSVSLFPVSSAQVALRKSHEESLQQRLALMEGEMKLVLPDLSICILRMHW